MASRLETRALSVLGRLGSVPADPAAARALFQRRMSAYFAIAAALWTSTWAATLLLVVAFASDLGPAKLRDPLSWLHLATGLVLGAIWVALRRQRPSLGQLAALDLVATFAQALMLGALLAGDAPTWAPENVYILGLTYLLVGRAAIVPGTPRRTAAAGALASLPLVGGTFWLYTHHALPAHARSVGMLVGSAAVWCTIAVFLTTAIAAVIYGLAEHVRAALRLGQYVLEEKIGEGGMGVVYKARHALLRRPTAVKLLPEKRAGARAIARFEREVQLTAKLAHPNIVVVYDFGRSPDDVFYYAMEYLDGIDLERLAEGDGPQPPGRVLHLLVQAADALAEAHAVGLIHRDIKPANLLLCRAGRRHDLVKLLDFGLVKELDRRTGPVLSDVRTLTGTPLYMAPEVLTAPERIDGRSDLYALGAVGYYLLTGAPVFEGTTIVEVCGKHLHAEVVPPSRRAGRAVPPKLERAILACLAKAPDDRPASADALLALLRGCDDVPAWPADAAARWWAERAPALRDPARAARRRARREGSSPTLAIDLAGRDAPSPLPFDLDPQDADPRAADPRAADPLAATLEAPTATPTTTPP